MANQGLLDRIAFVGLRLCATGGRAHAHAHAQEIEAELEIREQISIAKLRMQTEELERRGENLACANAYLQTFTTYPGTRAVDERLYNSGVCYEQALSPGLAIQSYELLQRRMPSSHLAGRALVRVGSLYAAVANYDRAAAAYETYAKRYASEKNHFNSWSRVCESRLAKLRPEEFPTRGKAHGEPDASGSIDAVEAVTRQP